VPFTVSHVVAVLPLRRSPLAVAPLVIGSMTPDLPMYLGLIGAREQLHRPTSVLTLDAALTLALALGWAWGLRPVVADLWPGLATRWTPDRPWRSLTWPARARRAGVWYLSAVIGVLTHLGLDSFTHSEGFVVRRVPVLTDPVAGVGVFYLLQVVTSVLGLGLLGWWARRWWRTSTPADTSSGRPPVRRPPVRRPPVRRPPVDGRRLARWLVGGLLVVLAVAFVIAVPQAIGPRGHLHLRMLLARTLFISGGIASTVGFALAVVHRVRLARRPDSARENADPGSGA
jgi:hypothetical protein